MQLSRVITGVFSLCMITSVHAVPPEFAAAVAELKAQNDVDMLQRSQEFMNSSPSLGVGPALQGPNMPTEDEVGDVDSFGDPVIYLGVQQSESVTFQADCSEAPPDFGACIELPEDLSMTSSVDESNLAVFQLPRRATESLICFNVTMFASWSWLNTTGVSEFATMTVNPTFQIESDVLNDPALIDPVSGLPFNGQLFPDGARGLSTFFEFRNLEAGDFEFKAPRLTRDCTAGLVSSRVLRDVYGLTNAQVRRFFRRPITVSFGVRGNISSVDSASFSYGIRLYGDT